MATITAESTEQALAHLDELGRALTAAGYLTMIVTDGSRSRLEVLNRTSPGRYGSVLCELDGNGDHWFWWSWADRIAPATDLARAAAVVDGLLRVAEEAA